MKQYFAQTSKEGTILSIVVNETGQAISTVIESGSSTTISNNNINWGLLSFITEVHFEAVKQIFLPKIKTAKVSGDHFSDAIAYMATSGFIKASESKKEMKTSYGITIGGTSVTSGHSYKTREELAKFFNKAQAEGLPIQVLDKDGICRAILNGDEVNKASFFMRDIQEPTKK